MSQLERERQENSDLKSRLHRIETTYSSYVSSENELADANTRLRHEVDVLKDEMRNAREEIARGRTETDAVVARRAAAWTEERTKLERQHDELTKQTADYEKKLKLLLDTNAKVCASYYPIFISSCLYFDLDLAEEEEDLAPREQAQEQDSVFECEAG